MNYYQKPGFLNTIPTVTRNIIIINVIMWVATLAFEYFNNVGLVQILGLHYFQAPEFKIYQLVTYMFLHGSFSHIFFNMFAVYMFGQAIENRWGTKKYLLFYMITGIGAGLMQECVWYFNLQETITGYQFITDGHTTVSIGEYLNNFITIGASGAVFGILLAFGMLYPNVELMFLFVPIPIKAKYFVIIYGALELFLGIANFGGDNVAHFAHLGGMLFGFLMILYWRKKDRNYYVKDKGFTAWLTKIANLFKRKPKNKMKITYQTSGWDKKRDYDYNAKRNEENAEIDRILEKIKQSGYNCLSDEEKRKLFDASNK